MGNVAYKNEYYEVKDELLDGKVVAMSPSAGMNHAFVTDNILNIFKNFLKGKPCKAFGNLNVYLTDKDRTIPDVMIVCDKNIMKPNGIYGAPDLIVEVLSPSTANKDKGYKKNLYEKCGVNEYWLADAANMSIEVHLLQNGKYVLDNVYSIYADWQLELLNEDEKSAVIYKFSPSQFPDMVVDLEQVFEDMM